MVDHVSSLPTCKRTGDQFFFSVNRTTRNQFNLQQRKFGLDITKKLSNYKGSEALVLAT